MARTNPIVTVDTKGWVKGLNREADPFQLDVEESPDCLDVDFGRRGAVSKRKGSTRFDTAGLADYQDRIAYWQRLGGAAFLIVASDVDGSLKHASATAFTDSTYNLGAASNEDGYPIGVATLNNKIYFTAIRSGGQYSFDGTTWTSLTETVFDGTSARFPEAKHLLAAHDRMFAANVDDSAVRRRSRLHWSNAVDPETWDALDYWDFTPDDGQEITALALLGEQIVVFKESAIHVLVGRDPDSFAGYPTESVVGTRAPRTVVVDGADILFFDQESGVWAFDGSGLSQLDVNINSYLLDGINTTAAYKASAFVHRRRYYLSVPWGSETINSRTFVLDRVTGAWTEYSYGLADAASDGVDWFGGHPGYVGTEQVGVAKLFNGATDGGFSFTPYFKTAWLAPGGPEAKHRIHRLDMAFSALGEHTVTVDMLRDFAQTAYISQDVSVSAGGAVYGTAVYGADSYGGGVDEVLLLTTGWGKRWRVVQFKFYPKAAASDDMQLNRFAMHISSLPRVRGEA